MDLKDVMTFENKNFDRHSFGEVDKNFCIWSTCHAQHMIKEYTKKETSHFKIFNSANVGYSGYHLNNLCRFLNEGCTLIYPYMNNLRSEIIGFEHYRRSFDTIDFDKIKKGYLQYYEDSSPVIIRKFPESIVRDERSQYKNLLIHCAYYSLLSNEGFTDLYDFYKLYYPDLLENERKRHKFYGRNMFVCKWDQYCEIAKLIIRYIYFMNDRYNLEYNEEKWYMYLYQHIILRDNINKNNPNYYKYDKGFYYDFAISNYSYDSYIGHTNASNVWRLLAYHIEYLVSCYINSVKKKFMIEKKDENI